MVHFCLHSYRAPSFVTTQYEAAKAFAANTLTTATSSSDFFMRNPPEPLILVNYTGGAFTTPERLSGLPNSTAGVRIPMGPDADRDGGRSTARADRSSRTTRRADGVQSAPHSGCASNRNRNYGPAGAR